MRTAVIVGLFVSACSATQTPELQAPQAPLRESAPAPRVPQAASPSLVDEDGALLTSFEDGPATLVSLTGRCVGEVQGGRFQGCPLQRVQVVLPGDAIATLLPPQSDEAPALAVDAPLRGGFPGHSLRFSMESEAGDALCPGAPTRVSFLDNEVQLGEVFLDAAVPRQLGHGVVGLLVSASEVFVLLNWGRDSWRLVDTTGLAVSEGHFAASECECCE